MLHPLPPCLILAGGAGLRMGGRDKALILLEGRPLLSHVLERIAPQSGEVWLSSDRDPQSYESFGLEVLPDTLPGRLGPLAGIVTAMDRAARAEVPHVLTVAVDTPIFPSDLTARLSAATGPSALAMARGADESGEMRRHPTFGLWPVALRHDLRRAVEAGVRRVGAWAAGQDLHLVDFAGEEPFLNINTPADLDRAAARLTRTG